MLTMTTWTTPRLVVLAPAANAELGGSQVTDGGSGQYGNS